MASGQSLPAKAGADIQLRDKPSDVAVSLVGTVGVLFSVYAPTHVFLRLLLAVVGFVNWDVLWRKH